MKRGSLLAASAAFVVGVAVIACSAKDIEARHYDQSCAKDDDCVAVTELTVKGSNCSMGCGSAAINKKDKDAYEADFEEARADCEHMTSPDCALERVPACIEGKCELRTPPATSTPAFGSPDGG